MISTTSLIFVAGIGPLCYFVPLVVQSDSVQELWSAKIVFYLIGYGLGITAITSVVVLPALGWMRLLGYRLYTRSECVVEDGQ